MITKWLWCVCVCVGWGGGVYQCAKGTQDTESSISNDTLKPDAALITSANKETKRRLHTVF